MLKYGEVWLILKVKQRAFPDGLVVGCEKREEIKNDNKVVLA